MLIGGRNERPRCCFTLSIKKGSKYIGLWCYFQTLVCLVLLVFSPFLSLYGILMALPPSICFAAVQCFSDTSKNREILYVSYILSVFASIMYAVIGLTTFPTEVDQFCITFFKVSDTSNCAREFTIVASAVLVVYSLL